MKVSLFYFGLLFLFLFSLHEASEIQFETLDYDTGAHDLSSTSSECSRSRAPTNGSEKGAPLRLELVHRYGPCANDQEGSEKEVALTLAEILAKDQLRVQSIQVAAAASRTNDEAAAGEDYGPTQLPAHSVGSLGTANYVVTLSLGTPKQRITLLIDTGSVLTWTQCLPCSPNHCYKQNEPLFEPSASRSFSRIPCSSRHCADLGNHKRGGPGCVHNTPDCHYTVQYGSGGSSTGFYSTDKLTVSLSNMFYDFRFGCGNDNSVGGSSRFSGVLGLGRGRLSFVSQTQATFSGIFSYCLPLDPSSPGFISFGGEDYYKNMKGMGLTPLIRGPSDHYYIDISAIGVGGYRLPIKDSVFTTAGAIIDSGTVLTRLPPDAYKALAEELTKQMHALNHLSAPQEEYFLDTCFYIKEHNNEKIPKVSFTFEGGASFNLAASGILYFINPGKACLAFLSNRSPNALAILGNSQQRTLEVMYDLPKNMLGFRTNPRCI